MSSRRPERLGRLLMYSGLRIALVWVFAPARSPAIHERFGAPNTLRVLW